MPAASLSARRAWIEIVLYICHTAPAIVALRKESVDRNGGTRTAASAWIPSLSARRAWIEILVARPGVDPGGVALRKESVDRNAKLEQVRKSEAASLSARRAWIEIAQRPSCSRRPQRRSPQGERG